MKNKTKIILILSAILLLATIFGGYTNGSFFGGGKKYTYKELKEMPAEDLYQLFLNNGLKLPDHYKTATKEKTAEFLKSNFAMLSQGWINLSHTDHKEFAENVKAIYDKITYPPGTKVLEFIEQDADHDEAGYILELNLDKIPLQEITGQIKEAKDILIEQHESYNPVSSISPSYWKKDFTSSTEAREYIGLDKLRGFDWDLEEQNTFLALYGNEKGEFERLSLETYFETGEIQIQAITSIYTDIYKGDLTTGYYTTEDVKFYDAYLSTDNNFLYHIVDSTKAENDRCVRDGYLVQNGILYNLHLSYLDEVEIAMQAQEIIQKWANIMTEE